jgi:alkanesulfonate monooxygenase SsuD/methylene tetrahydromethanopterin reductase-like flavin-dependent oxidoreductase (luciferase family)
MKTHAMKGVMAAIPMHIDIALEPEYTADELAELAVLAERNGISTIWVTNDPQARDLFMLFTKAAAVTHKIRLGVMAVSPLEIHPLKLAGALLTLNEMSGGRASLVVGGGGAILANTRLDLSRRVRAVDECIEILKRAGAAQPLNYAGELFPVWNFQPRWAVDQPPRVLAGANREQMLRMAAKQSDGIHMSDMPLPLVASTRQIVEQALKSNGRSPADFEFNNFWAFHVKPDRAAAEREARSRLVLRGMLKRFYIEPFLDEAATKLVRDNMQSFYAAFHKREGDIANVPEPIIDTLVKNLTLTCATSDLDTHMATLHDFSEAGLTHITLGLHDDPTSDIKLIGARVLPIFNNH